MSQPEKCAHCKKPKPIALYRQYSNGNIDGLCQKCSMDWLESDQEWSNTQLDKGYYGPFPQKT